MASDNDPSVLHRMYKAYVPGGKKLGQGRLSHTPREKFVSQNEERDWVDVLLDCSSPRDEKLDSTVNGLSWEEVSTGWRSIVPNATYVSRVTDKKDADKDKEKDSGKSKSSHKLISFEKDLRWKQCVEPGTYRYVHRSAYAGVQRKHTFNKGPVKRPMDANLREHIRKVKEHLEKVLVQQASPRTHHRPLGTVHNYGDYVSSLIREARPSGRLQPASEVRHSPRAIRPSQDPAQQTQTKVPDVGVTYAVKRASPVQKFQKSSPSPRARPLPQPESKVSHDLVDALGSKVNDLIQQDNFKHRVQTRHSKNKTPETLRSSYEKFTVPAQVESPTLKPLVKVTPGQRQIHDDNKFISAVAKMNKQASYESDDSPSVHRVSPTPGKDTQRLCNQETKEVAHERRFQKLDPANKHFFTYGVAGKAVSPTDIDVRVKNLAGISRMLSKNPAEVKKRGTLYQPQKQGPNRHRGKGDPGFTIANRLADPLHRGVVDRGVAGAIASELLPGVSGHKIRFPMQQAYRIT